ncbi:MAG: hypothetical protein P8127_02845 [Acidobacteriota bacterium]
MMQRFRIAAVVLTTILAACATGGLHQTDLMKQSQLSISAAELKVQVRSLAPRFSGLMEEAGEEALGFETQPEKRRNVLLWLTNGIPAMQQALFQPDPLAALFDAWFLIAQLRDHFERSLEAGMSNRSNVIANQVLDDMESDIKRIIHNAGPATNYERGRQLVYEKSKDHPVNASFASRRGSAADLAEFTTQSGWGAMKSLETVTESVEDLAIRIDLNAEYLPKIARWQAMIFVMDEGFDDAAETVLENLQYVEFFAAEVDRLSPIIESLPELVSSERVAVLEALDAYLTRTLSFINQQREILMTEDVRAEREAVLAAIEEERIAVFEAIADERAIVLDALRDERAVIFEDLDALIDDAFSRELNKIFVRGLLLVGLFLAGFGLIVYLGVRSLKEKS